MLRNVERKEGLPERVRNAAKSCLGTGFGTNNPDVFEKMLENGMYDGMCHGKEAQKKISGQSR